MKTSSPYFSFLPNLNEVPGSKVGVAGAQINQVVSVEEMMVGIFGFQLRLGLYRTRVQTPSQGICKCTDFWEISR